MNVEAEGQADGDVETRLDSAKKLFRRGHMQEAEAAFKGLRDAAADLDARQFVETHLGLAKVLNETDRRRQALETLAAIEARDPKNADAAGLHMQIAYALNLYDETMAAADLVIEGRPEDHFGYYMKALACLHRDRKNPDNQQQAIELFELARARAPGNRHVLGALGVAVMDAGEYEYVRALGQEVLYRKDKEACRAFAKSDFRDVTLNPVDRSFDPQRKKHNIISFSLFGDNPLYLQGAIANAEIAPFLYPEWTCRFYVDGSIPAEIVRRLEDLRAEVVVMDANQHWNGTFWRFLVSDDPDVDYFLIRDVDSRLNVQERVAVEEWLTTGKSFHIMRDHMVHREMVLAGMWGGAAGVIPDMEGLYRRKYFQMAKAHADQLFLKDVIWPLIREDTLIHDSFYRYMESRDYPKYGKLPWNLHIGCGFKTTKAWFWYWP